MNKDSGWCTTDKHNECHGCNKQTDRAEFGWVGGRGGGGGQEIHRSSLAYENYCYVTVVVVCACWAVVVFIAAVAMSDACCTTLWSTESIQKTELVFACHFVS